MYKGTMNNVKAKIYDLNIRGSHLPHNALKDAKIQAKEYLKVREIMAKKQKLLETIIGTTGLLEDIITKK